MVEDEPHYRPTSELMHDYKLKQLREKTQKMRDRRDVKRAKNQQREELRSERKSFLGVKKEMNKERTEKFRGMVGKFDKFSKGFAHGLGKMGSGAAPPSSRQPQKKQEPQKMFSFMGTGDGGGYSFGSNQGGNPNWDLGVLGKSKFNMSLGRQTTRRKRRKKR